DIVVTARHGWLFATQNTPGTTHGYPLAESVHATWYVSGPNIRRGARVEAPCRLADLTPTILDLTGTEYEPGKMDGRALRNIYEAEPEEIRQRTIGPIIRINAQAGETVVRERPMFWEEFDLHAWQPLNYTPAPEYEHMPLSMNRPGSGWDINNITYNAISIGDWSVFRLIDDVLSPVNPGSRTKKKRLVEPGEADERALAEKHQRRGRDHGDGARRPRSPEI